MIYYDFSKFQPIYYKRTLRSTIHMSHRLRREPPGLHLIAAGGPWAEIETEEVLALLKYPFYPLFNFDNGMNLISKSLTILTLAQLLVVFAFAHIFWRYFVFAGF